MVSKYRISLSCVLLLLEFATQSSAQVCASGQYFSLACINCPIGQHQAIAAQCSDKECCLPCGQSTYQYYIETFGVIYNVGCKRCPTRHQSDFTPTDSNRDGTEDCKPCSGEHSYMVMIPDQGENGGVYYQCRICPEHSTQDETIYDEHPPRDYEAFGNADNSMSCLCNAGFSYEEAALSWAPHSCVECPSGKFKNMISNTETCSCNVGYVQGIDGCRPYAEDPSALCEENPTCCTAGTYYDTSMQDCVECNENTFKPFDGEHTCMPCPAHTSCPHTGCVSCIPDLMDASIQCPDDQIHVAGDYIAHIKTYV